MYELKRGEKIVDVKGYEGVYAVTTHGRVWSIRYKRWIKPYLTGNGYCTVRLCLDCREEDRKVHGLVGEAFISNPENKPQINHKNGIKIDNRVSNLQWVTARENIQHASDNGLNKTHRFTLIEKLLICKMHYLLNIRKACLARMFDVSAPGIHYIIKEYSQMAIS